MIRIIETINGTRTILQKARREGKRIGFVPTMGALHEGHASLIRRSKKENDITVLSIFVNPLQFGPSEDFAAYPREKKKDIFLAKKENVDIITYPSVKEIYPERFLTYVDVKNLSEKLCGASRPGHFRGVSTVVCKLLNIVQPDNLYLGQKDAQQVVILKQMIRDLDMPVQVVVCPTVREPDGLAMSSRNKHLSADERKEAVILYQALRFAGKFAKTKTKQPEKLISHIRRLISTNSSGKIDYITCINPETLEPMKLLQGPVLVALAVKFGKARLIDNRIIRFS